MSTPKSQAGYSLIELLISLVITCIAVLAAVALLSKFTRNAGAFSEVSAMEETRASAETLLRKDFDSAGYHLTRPSPPLAGTIPVLYQPSNDFNLNIPGTATKTSGAGWSSVVSTYSLAMGLGSFNATLPASGASISATSQTGQSRTIIVQPNNTLAILEDGMEVAGTSGTGAVLTPHQGGDAYTISIENSPADSTVTRVVRYYRTRAGVKSLLLSSNGALPAYPISHTTSLYYQGETISNATITGAPLFNLYTNSTDIPSMPMDGGVQLSGPITITGGGSSVVILSGDSATDAVSTVTDFPADSNQLNVRLPQRGSLNIGDILMAIDYGNINPTNPASPATSLCRITNTASSVGGLTLTVDRIRSANAAWGRLWSRDIDHQHTFLLGETIIVKLKAPVTYALSSDSRLVRVNGDRASTIAFKTRRFNVTHSITPPYQAFQVGVTLASEGFETNTTAADETRGTIQFDIRPRGLNLASNQLY